MVSIYCSTDKISEMMYVKRSSMIYHLTDKINELKVAFAVGMKILEN